MASGNLGPYELRKEIGRGAMARVWRAWDPHLEREVAIKEPLLNEDLAEDVRQEMAQRFVKEAKAAARLSHPNIVTVYAADIYNNRPAIIMELIEGATLGDVLEKNGALSPDAALEILDQILDAMDYAHSKGVIHRDLKPDNIFLTKDGDVKVGDFGIAHIDDSAATQATRVGSVLGTPGYMSPEQARGAEVDARSDLFSIGIIAYEMLTGQNPFSKGKPDATTLIYRIVHEDVPVLNIDGVSGLSNSMSAAIDSALSKDAGERPSTAKAFKVALHGETAIDTASSQQEISTKAEVSDAVKKSKRPAWLPYIIVVAICAIAIGIFFAATSLGENGSTSTANSAQIAAQDASPTPSSVSASPASSVSVPNICDMSENDALSALDLKGLEGENSGTQSSSLVPVGYVIEQYPTAGTTVESGTSIRYIVSSGSTTSSSVSQGTTYYVCASDSITLRTSPTTKADKICMIDSRESVKVKSIDGSWAYISYDGKTGYVLAKFLSTDPNAPLNDDPV